MRKLDSKKIVIASRNPGKIIEMAELLKPFNYTCSSMINRKIESPEENGINFNENAEIKAINAAVASNLPSIADDSGLTIEALNGAPGIHSKRWAEENDGYDGAFKAIEELLFDKLVEPEFIPKAHFVCALTIAWPDHHTETVVGSVSGKLCFPKRGENGFGYDPIFIPHNHKLTFAQMPSSKKKNISHRKLAFDKLAKNILQTHP